MYYEHDGKIYGVRLTCGAQLWERVTVVRGADGAVCIVGTGDGASAPPPGALPLTRAEVLARHPAQEPTRRKRIGKAVESDVS